MLPHPSTSPLPGSPSSGAIQQLHTLSHSPPPDSQLDHLRVLILPRETPIKSRLQPLSIPIPLPPPHLLLPTKMAQPPRSDPDLWVPPVTLCSAINKESFAYESTTKRWPSILSNLVASLQQATYALSYSSKDQKPKIQEAEQIIEKVHALVKAIADDEKLQPINGSPSKDGAPETKDSYDALIQKESWSWHNAPW